MTAKRGRPSAGDLSLIGEEAKELVKIEARLLAPEGLNLAEKAVWSQLVNDQPAGVFSPVHIPIMTLYCRHVARGNDLANIATQLYTDGVFSVRSLEYLDSVLKMIDRETKAASAMARALRITRQSADESRAVGKLNAKHRAASRVVKPWDDV